MSGNEKRTPMYSQIRNYVLANIQQQRWRSNDQLPTESELAGKFGVSKFTVKKALVELVEEGLIYRIQGKGSFVSASVNGQLARSEHAPAAMTAHTAIVPGPDASKQIVYLSPFIHSRLSGRVLSGVERCLSERGYQLVVRSTNNKQETERRLLWDSVQSGARGVLVFPVDGESYNEELLRLTLNKFPVVVIDRYLRGIETNCVCSDHEGGAYEATKHLIGLGHARIAYVAVHDKPTTSLDERLDGFEKAMAEHGLASDLKLVHYDSEHSDSFERLTSILLEFLERHPEVTAVFAAGTSSGLAVMKAAEQLGRQVPEQLSVLFFDDFEYAAFSRIPPTCVAQQEERLGEEAAKLLLSVIDNPLQERRKILLSTQLIVRSSTMPPQDGGDA